MACTTILVGKKASYDGSTMIARNDDGGLTNKKMIVHKPSDSKLYYKSKIGHCVIDLPEKALGYTACPNVDLKEGVWEAFGINSENVGMSATETITTNPLVMGGDPYVVYQPKKGNQKEVAGGIGEEDLITIVLPYIKSAREGVLRLGELLEKYGTYEANGIAFNDAKECWWLETIGGHHWIARRVKDDEYVMMPNQFGLDRFDFEDAMSKKKENMCSRDLLDFIQKNHLEYNDKDFNPRYAFGSHNDADHVYNTPRSWFMGRYFNPTTYVWDGEDADFTPESDFIPWSLVPERKITVEDIKYVLSSYYQGTPYNPYGKDETGLKGKYRPIGISRTDDMGILQIRPYMPKQIQAIEWVCFGSNAFNTLCPVYTNTDSIPKYLSSVTDKITTDNLYWNSRLLGALSDAHYGKCIMHIERYQAKTANKSHQIINEYDEKMTKTKEYALIKEANEKLAKMIEEETSQTLNKVLHESLMVMKNNYYRFDN